MNHPENMWPSGRLRYSASLADLNAELEWQRHFRRQTIKIGHSVGRQAANANIRDIRRAIKRKTADAK